MLLTYSTHDISTCSFRTYQLADTVKILLRVHELTMYCNLAGGISHDHSQLLFSDNSFLQCLTSYKSNLLTRLLCLHDIYCKLFKVWILGHSNQCHNEFFHIYIWTSWFVRESFTTLLANSADPYQNAPKEQSDLGLHCFLLHTCPNTSGSVQTVNSGIGKLILDQPGVAHLQAFLK